MPRPFLTGPDVRATPSSHVPNYAPVQDNSGDNSGATMTTSTCQQIVFISCVFLVCVLYFLII